MTATYAPFLQHIRDELGRAGVELELIDAESLEGGTAGAAFYPTAKHVRAATKRPANVWIPNLAHEVCHVQQWRSNSKAWQGLMFEGRWCQSIIWNWRQGLCELSDDQLRLYLGRLAYLEWDCERRTIRLLAKWPALGTDLEFYAVWMNEYVLSYQVAAATRQWLDPNAITKHRRKLMALLPHKPQPWSWFAHDQSGTEAYQYLRRSCMTEQRQAAILPCVEWAI